MALLTQDELRALVSRLAAFERPSASPGERRTAEAIAGERNVDYGTVAEAARCAERCSSG